MRKPIYKAGKGMKFIRYGGLSSIKQKNQKAPSRRGLWAFILPHFDWWFLGNPCSHGHGRFKKDGGFNPGLLKKFFYEGEIYTPLSVPGGEVVQTPNGDTWTKTTTKALFKRVKKVYAEDIGDLLQDEFSPSEMRELISRTYRYMSVDHYEVFIPGKVK